MKEGRRRKVEAQSRLLASWHDASPSLVENRTVDGVIVAEVLFLNGSRGRTSCGVIRRLRRERQGG